MPILAVLYLIR